MRGQLVLARFRRTTAAVAVWAIAGGAVVLWPTGAGGQANLPPGRGTASAQVWRIDPRQAGLSLGVTFGLSLAGHQNTIAQADSRAVDLGIIGTTLAGEGCDGGDPTLPEDQQPQALQVRTGDEGAAEGRRQNESGGVDQFARATAAPFGEAITTIAPNGVAGVIEVAGATATAKSGNVADGVREARAVTEFERIELGGGAVVLHGARWEAVHRSGAEAMAEAVFSLEGMTVAGTPVPGAPGDPVAAIGQANEALRLLGFELTPPETRVVEGVVFLDPLRIGVVSSQIRDDVLSPVFGAVQPTREDLFDAFLEIDCGNSTYVLIADIVLGSVTASGSFGIELGGVQASTADIDLFQLDKAGAAGGPLPPVGPGQPVTTPTSAAGSTGGGSAPAGGGSPQAGGSEEPAATDAVAPQEQAATVADEGEGARGGAMAGVALGGLLLAGAMAEGDRRKMRRAQREMPLDA